MQLTQEYVQKSTSTTLPRSPASESGWEAGVLIPAKRGAGPTSLRRSGELPAATAAFAWAFDVSRARRSALTAEARSGAWIHDREPGVADARGVGRLVVNSHAPIRSTTPEPRRSARPCRRTRAKPESARWPS